MKLVRENINFERGIDPKKSLGLGKKSMYDTDPEILKDDIIFLINKLGFSSEADHTMVNKSFLPEIWIYIDTRILKNKEILIFKNKVMDFIKKYTNYEIISFRKTHTGHQTPPTWLLQIEN